MGTPAEFQIARARNVDCNPGTITAPASLSRAISAVNLASSYRFTRRLRGPTGDSLRCAALAPPTRSYMHNFFKPVATSTGGEPAPKRSRPSVPTWKAVHESMLVRDDPGCRPNHRIAAFDLDDTLFPCGAVVERANTALLAAMAARGASLGGTAEITARIRAIRERSPAES